MCNEKFVIFANDNNNNQKLKKAYETSKIKQLSSKRIYMFCFSFLCNELRILYTKRIVANIVFAWVVSHGCGIDIHKEVVATTVRTYDYLESCEFKTFTSSLTWIREWLKIINVIYVAIKNTGMYCTNI